MASARHAAILISLFFLSCREFASITGKSGCGKSTLLYILSTLDTDYKGDVLINGAPMRGKKGAELALVRNQYIGLSSILADREAQPGICEAYPANNRDGRWPDHPTVGYCCTGPGSRSG